MLRLGGSLVYQHFKCKCDTNTAEDVLQTPGVRAEFLPGIQGGHFLQGLLDKAGASLRLGHILDEFHFKEAIRSLPG